VILGSGCAKEGYTATDIDPMARGVGLMLAEGERPRRIKAAYLPDKEIQQIASYEATLRNKRDQEGHLRLVESCDGGEVAL
jgi:S-DNA-T family DNA segregation ATPase FtsK/SpoIIIE